LPDDDAAALEMRLKLAIVLSKRGDVAAASAALSAVEEYAARRGDAGLASLAELERCYLEFWRGNGRSARFSIPSRPRKRSSSTVLTAAGERTSSLAR